MTRSAFTRKYARFRRVLAEARRAKGLTQVELAKKLGRPQSFVSKFEGGERRLDVIEFLEVARALKVNPLPIIADVNRRYHGPAADGRQKPPCPFVATQCDPQLARSTQSRA